ncbi:MAG: ribonuclease E/G [Flavobacteriaceae bacterium]|nr:MAG: ribonuclease E/G [Flavobacteriaceae bacterium]
MNKELILSAQEEKIRIALLLDGRLIELHTQTLANKFSVGDVYVGKVKKLATNLNASFVDIGHPKNGFLHYQDLGPHLLSFSKYYSLVRSKKINSPKLSNFTKEEEIPKDGKIETILNPGDNIIVQVSKEPISTKGPRLTSEISLAGRFLILLPFSKKISVSQKIKEISEKKRLIRLLKQVTPQGFGVIVRTVAEGKEVEEIRGDLENLLSRWAVLHKTLEKAPIPSRVLSEMDRASSIIRDTFTDQFTKIVCDDPHLTLELKNYINGIAPGKEKIVSLHDNPIVPIFEEHSIERQIKQSFGTTVNIPGSKGAYLVIEHTEALHVIDVNSGNISNKIKADQAENSLRVNLQSATEIARQLRLRDMGGIIVVDFIDMASPEARKELFDHLTEAMKDDPAKHKILPPSKFGLIQITRQRVRPETDLNTKEKNPSLIDLVEAPITLLSKFESEIRVILNENPKSKIYLHLHPFVAGYLKSGFPSPRLRWFFKHKKWIHIIPRDAYSYLEYNFLDHKSQPLIKKD